MREARRRAEPFYLNMVDLGSKTLRDRENHALACISPEVPVAVVMVFSRSRPRFA
jgi:hypothetical protein